MVHVADLLEVLSFPIYKIDTLIKKNNLMMRRLAGSMRVGAHVNFKDG